MANLKVVTFILFAIVLLTAAARTRRMREDVVPPCGCCTGLGPLSLLRLGFPGGTPAYSYPPVYGPGFGQPIYGLGAPIYGKAPGIVSGSGAGGFGVPVTIIRVNTFGGPVNGGYASGGSFGYTTTTGKAAGPVVKEDEEEPDPLTL